MKDYELLYVISGDESEEAANKVTDAVNASLMKIGGKVTSEDTWGRKRLAYEIAKQTHGWYVVTRFALDGGQVPDFDRELRLNKGVIRHVIVRAEELPTEEDLKKAEDLQSPSRDSRRTTSAKPSPAPAAKPAAERKPETEAEKKRRQSKVEEKLGEILKEE